VCIFVHDNFKYMKQFRDTPYYVTENGEVYRLWKFKGFKKLKPHLREGYLRVSICKNGKRKIESLNRMIAEVFLPNPNNLPEVNHIDTNKLNNHVSNLEWCTSFHNKEHAKKNNLYKAPNLKGKDHGNSKLTEQDIIWIRKNYIPRHKEFGQYSISLKFNIHQSQISNIVNNKRWKHITPEQSSES